MIGTGLTWAASALSVPFRLAEDRHLDGFDLGAGSERGFPRGEFLKVCGALAGVR